MLVIEGESPELPPHTNDENVVSLWKYITVSSLSRLYAFSEEIGYESETFFINEVNALVNRQIPHRFKVLDVLREL